MSTTKEQQPAQPVQLCAFDTERDYPEGEEARQILAYHPEGCSIDDQTSVVGLAQALLTFAGNFDEDAVCDSMDAERNIWVFHRPETDIVLLMVVERGWLPTTVQDAGLKAVLQQAYMQYTLLHGSLRDMLVSDAEGVRAALQSVLDETAARLLRSKSKDLALLQSPLSMVSGVSWLPLANHVFTAVHSLASQLTIADLGDGQLAQGVMVLQDQYCLWSSLSQQNTASLYRLACTALVPASQGPSIGKRLASATASLRSQQAQQPQHPVQNYKAWVRSAGGFLSLLPSAAEAESEQLFVPTVHLQGGEEQPMVLGYCQGSAVLIILLSQQAPVSSRTQQAIAQIAQAPLRRISQATAEQLTTQRHCHVAGFRYLYVDQMLTAVQASPQNKVATLSSESLELMASAREQLQAMSQQQDDDKEVVARGTHDCWVVARCRSGRELYLVMEGKGEVGLAGASKLASNFTDNHFPAVF